MAKYDRTGRRHVLTRSEGEVMLQPMEDDAISKSARHKSLKNSTLYYENSMTLWFEYGLPSEKNWGPNWVTDPCS